MPGWRGERADYPYLLAMVALHSHGDPVIVATARVVEIRCLIIARAWRSVACLNRCAAIRGDCDKPIVESYQHCEVDPGVTLTAVAHQRDMDEVVSFEIGCKVSAEARCISEDARVRGFSRRLGFRSNVVHGWELGQCWTPAVRFLQCCERLGIDVPQSYTDMFKRPPAWLQTHPPAIQATVVDSKDTDCVGLYCVQLLDLGAEASQPSRQHPDKQGAP